MSISDSLKFFRNHRNFSQQEMPLEDRSKYSRLENGKTKVSEDLFAPLSDKLSITVTELLLFADLDTELNKFQKLIKKGIQTPHDSKIENKIIEHYNRLKKIRKKNSKEMAMYYAIVVPFSKIYSQIEPITKDNITDTFLHLINQTFYGQYDYLLAFNMSLYFSSDQLHTLVQIMFPITNRNQRTIETITYANNLLSNILTVQIYNLEYKKVIEYAKKFESNELILSDYYYRIHFNYSKYLALYLSKREEKYREEIFKYIGIFEGLGDQLTAGLLTNEVKNLESNPRYYLDLNEFESTHLK